MSPAHGLRTLCAAAGVDDHAAPRAPPASPLLGARRPAAAALPEGILELFADEVRLGLGLDQRHDALPRRVSVGSWMPSSAAPSRCSSPGRDVAAPEARAPAPGPASSPVSLEALLVDGSSHPASRAAVGDDMPVAASLEVSFVDDDAAAAAAAPLPPVAHTSAPVPSLAPRKASPGGATFFVAASAMTTATTTTTMTTTTLAAALAAGAGTTGAGQARSPLVPGRSFSVLQEWRGGVAADASAGASCARVGAAPALLNPASLRAAGAHSGQRELLFRVGHD
jgi:hypothetical protein